MRDVLPTEKGRREAVLDTIRSVYTRFGFCEIETPALETLERLRSNQGGDNESMLFEVLKRGLASNEAVFPGDAVDLALRYDLTLPLTRFYATHASELPSVFRSLQIGPVWRAERPQKGRYRQFTQCDIDVIGEASSLAEVDLLIATLAAFEELGMADDVTLLINDRRILQDLMEAAGFETAQIPAALISLDKLDKIGEAGVRKEMLHRKLASSEVIDELLSVITLLRDQDNLSSLSLREGNLILPGDWKINLYELPAIVQTVTEVLPWAAVVFDASLVRGMGYYTGPIFEITHAAASSSVAGGGRYDGVVGQWLGRDVPACGFSLGFERIVDLVFSRNTRQQRIALFYNDDTPATELMLLRKSLMTDGSEVTLVRPPRKLSRRFLNDLVAEGITHICDPRNGTEDAEVRKLEAQQ